MFPLFCSPPHRSNTIPVELLFCDLGLGEVFDEKKELYEWDTTRLESAVQVQSA